MKKMKIRFQAKSKLESRLKYFSDDNLMDVSQKQFLKQQDQLADLQNHLRTFIRGIIDITNTLDNMYSSFKGIYETNWIGNVEFNHMCQESVKIWRQFISDFKSNISKAIDEYSHEYPDMKRSIEKRNKKFDELNKQRLVYENYRNAKKVDDIKLRKAELEMKSIEQDYNNLNDVLKESLPHFCDKRIRIYVDFWKKLFEAEEAMFSFLQEGRKYQLGILSKLSDVADSGQYNIRSQVSMVNGNDSNLLSTKAYAQSAMSLVNPEYRSIITVPFEHGSLTDINSPNQPTTVTESKDGDSTLLNRTKSYQINARIGSEMSDSSNTSFFTLPPEKVVIKKRISFTENSVTVKTSKDDIIANNPYSKIDSKTKHSKNLSDSSDIDIDEYDNVSQSTRNGDEILKPCDLEFYENKYDNGNRRNITYQVQQEIESYYQVIAEFDYEGQDDDELDLKKNDVLLVLPWDSEEQMEEGWLFGENILTKRRGLFPENHTTKLDS